MATPNPEIQRLLDEAKRELAETKAEKSKLFPPNLHPFGEPDKFPRDYTPDQIAKRNALNARIESLEKRIDDLQSRLYAH